MQFLISTFLILFSPLTFSAQDACNGIDFHYMERIESQGFFGLSTPDADYRLIKDSLQSLEEDSKIARDAMREEPRTEKGKDWKRYMNSWELRDRDWKLQELCQVARYRGYKKLSFVCQGDTFSTDWNEYANLIGRDYMQVKCFISTGNAAIEDFDELEEKKIGDAFSHQNQVYNDERSALDRLQNKQTRKNSVYIALMQTIDGFHSKLAHEGKFEAAHDAWINHICSSNQRQAQPINTNAIEGQHRDSRGI